jgi:hypothetical protein
LISDLTGHLPGPTVEATTERARRMTACADRWERVVMPGHPAAGHANHIVDVAVRATRSVWVGAGVRPAVAADRSTVRAHR